MHTGAQTLRNGPLVQAIVNDLAAGLPMSAIAKDLRVSENTVSMISHLPLEAREAFRAGTVADIEPLCSKLLRKMDESIENGSIKGTGLPITFGILLDKRSLLLSEAPSSPHPDQKVDSHASLLDELRALRSRRSSTPSTPGPTTVTQVNVQVQPGAIVHVHPPTGQSDPSYPAR